eukprot:760412-Hanusia_phi.AAC.4
MEITIWFIREALNKHGAGETGIMVSIRTWKIRGPCAQTTGAGAGGSQIRACLQPTRTQRQAREGNW